LLELIAFCLAFVCGLIIFARIVKSCFGSKEYFKGIDRETIMLFGDSGNLVLDEKFKWEAAAADEWNKWVESSPAKFVEEIEMGVIEEVK